MLPAALPAIQAVVSFTKLVCSVAIPPYWDRGLPAPVANSPPLQNCVEFAPGVEERRRHSDCGPLIALLDAGGRARERPPGPLLLPEVFFLLEADERVV